MSSPPITQPGSTRPPSSAEPAFTLDVALTVDPGDVLAVLGPNGAGKSTLLDVLAGLLRPDAGHVRVGGRTLTDPGVHVPPHRRGVGLLAQQPLLFPHLYRAGQRRVRAACPGGVAPGRDGPRPGAARRRRRGRRSPTGGRRSSPAASSSASRSPARSPPGPDLLLLDEPLAALDVDTMPAMRALLRRTLREQRADRGPGHPRRARRAGARRPGRRARPTGSRRRGRARRGRCSPGRAARSPRGSRGSTSCPALACPEGLRTADGLVVAGHAEGTVDDGEPAVAVFPPAAVAVFAERPHGSPRNVVPVRLAAVEPHGDLVRLRAGVRDGGPAWAEGLAADVTPAALVDLPAEPGRAAVVRGQGGGGGDPPGRPCAVIVVG